LNSVVKKVQAIARQIQSYIVIQRIPKVPAWNRTLSQDINDWYSDADSARFSKQILTFTNKPDKNAVFIDATEFGDVLVLSKASYTQGVEIPTEDALTTNSSCGQCHTFPIYLKYETSPVPDQHIPKPLFNDYSLHNYTWSKIWSYRRSKAISGSDEAKPGEISNQNWGPPPGNDYTFGYIFLTKEETDKQAEDWKGGINLDILAKAENLAYGWYLYYRNHSDPKISPYLSLNREVVGTLSGLCKVPYLRDTRRSVGIHNFRIQYKDLKGTETSKTAFKFLDRVGVGDYLYADIHPLSTCSYPGYMGPNAVKPFFIPFRALTNRDYDNFLVAGKTMAQTFHANAATRLHPIEWASGLAAGVAATVMAEDNYTSDIIYRHHMKSVQNMIEKYSPLEWDLT